MAKRKTGQTKVRRIARTPTMAERFGAPAPGIQMAVLDVERGFSATGMTIERLDEINAMVARFDPARVAPDSPDTCGLCKQVVASGHAENCSRGVLLEVLRTLNVLVGRA